MEDFIKRLVQQEGIKYLIFGVLTTFINIVCYYILNSLHIPYIISNTIAFIVSIIFAFITNKLYVFNSKSWQKDLVLKEGIRFVSARIATFFLDTFIMVILIEGLGVHDFAAKCMANVVVIISNYLLSKLIIFKHRE